MVETRIFYRGCNKNGKEELLGEGGKLKKRKWLNKIENLDCEICGSNTKNGRGIFLITISRRSITEQEYYCFECCNDENIFKDFKENFEEFSYASDTGIL